MGMKGDIPMLLTLVSWARRGRNCTGSRTEPKPQLTEGRDKGDILLFGGFLAAKHRLKTSMSPFSFPIEGRKLQRLAFVNSCRQISPAGPAVADRFRNQVFDQAGRENRAYGTE